METYFLSDIHLGLPNPEKSREREKKLVQFLSEIQSRAKAIYFVGDIFDFWWEYKKVVPKGYVRFLGKIAEITDAGIPVHFFTGNHDIWIKDYLVKEIGVIVHHAELKTEIDGKSFYIAHGDGLGPGDFQYKMLKKIFTSKFLQWCFTRLHPNTALGFGHLWSNNRRKKEKYIKFFGEDKEYLMLFTKSVLQKEHFDYFLYGHRHLPMIYKISEKSDYINTGDWIYSFTFARFDGENLNLFTYKNSIIEKYDFDFNSPVIEDLDLYINH